MRSRTDEPVLQSFSLSIDKNDRIYEMDGAWREFAKLNGAADLPGKALGSSIWQFFAGAATVDFYQSLVGFSRGTGQDITFDTRCDSPTLKRRLITTISTSREGSVHFVSSLVGQEAPEIPLNKLEGSVAENYCPVCLSTRSDSNSPWIDADSSERSQVKLPIWDGDAGAKALICDACSSIVARLRNRSALD